MNDLIAPVVRRAILDLLSDIGGEHTANELTLLLNELGHRLAVRDVVAQVNWLAEAKLLVVQVFDQFTTARILTDGRDVADGRYIVVGVSKFKTGE
jgi:Fe2+ or Zn2+ uptake regulation protein